MTNESADSVYGPLAAVTDEVIGRMTRETAAARGLPNEAFTDPAFLALEREHVFTRTWTFAGVLSDVPAPGDVKPVEVAGQPLFMATGTSGVTRVFQNVCPHRGARLVIEETANASALTCPYHAWSFTLDGALRGRPHFRGPEQHDRGGNGAADVCLFEVRSAVWHDWVFVNLDGKAPDFETYMGPVMAQYQDWNLAAFRRGHYQPYAFHCNWKLAIENFCDNYHVFKVHPALHDMQTATDRFPMQPDGHHMFNWFVMGDEGRGLTIDRDGPILPEVPGLPREYRTRSPYCSVFPNATMALFPSNVEFFVFEPRSVDETVMHVWFYFAEDAAADTAHRDARGKVVTEWTNLNAEDAGICRRLQQGRACRAYDGGRFSPYWDVGTLHFHRQIAEAVRGIGAFER